MAGSDVPEKLNEQITRKLGTFLHFITIKNVMAKKPRIL